MSEGTQNTLFIPLKGHQGSISTVICDPQDSQFIYTASEDKTVRRWNLSTKKCDRVLLLQPFDHDAIGAMAVLYTSDTSVNVYVAQELTLLQYSIDLSDTSNLIIRDYTAKCTLPENAEEISALTLSNTSTLWIGCDSGEIFKYNAFNLELQQSTVAHDNLCTGLCYLPTTDVLISCGCDNLLRGWNSNLEKMFESSVESIEKSTVVRSTKSSMVSPSTTGAQALNPPFPQHICMTNDGQWVFVACGDGTISFRDATDGSEVVRLYGEHSHAIAACTCFEDPGKYITNAIETGSTECRPDVDRDGSATSNTNKRTILVSVGCDSRLVIWDISDILQHMHKNRLAMRAASVRSKLASGRKKKSNQKTNVKAHTIPWNDIYPRIVLSTKLIEAPNAITYDDSSKTIVMATMHNDPLMLTWPCDEM